MTREVAVQHELLQSTHDVRDVHTVARIFRAHLGNQLPHIVAHASRPAWDGSVLYKRQFSHHCFPDTLPKREDVSLDRGCGFVSRGLWLDPIRQSALRARVTGRKEPQSAQLDGRVRADNDALAPQVAVDHSASVKVPASQRCGVQAPPCHQDAIRVLLHCIQELIQELRARLCLENEEGWRPAGVRAEELDDVRMAQLVPLRRIALSCSNPPVSITTLVFRHVPSNHVRLSYGFLATFHVWNSTSARTRTTQAPLALASASADVVTLGRESAHRARPRFLLCSEP